MDRRLLRLHQMQVRFQCQAAGINHASAMEAGKAISRGDMRQMPLFFSTVQGFLSAVANISKECWGQGGKYKEKRRALRESLEIPDDSPLQFTELRNHFDHYDERLDEWFDASSAQGFADFLIGPKDMIQGLDDQDSFRHYEPATGLFYFGGKAYNLAEMAQLVANLLPVAQREADKPPWVD
jgi:hypothetical protein